MEVEWRVIGVWLIISGWMELNDTKAELPWQQPKTYVFTYILKMSASYADQQVHYNITAIKIRMQKRQRESQSRIQREKKIVWHILVAMES